MRSRSSSFSFWSLRSEASAAGLILALAVMLFFLPSLSGGRVWLPTRLLFHCYPYRGLATETPPPWNPLMWDGVAQFGVWRLYASQMWREGWLPLWNPHQGMGYPLYANSQSAVFYPPNALFAWLGASAFAWLAALHLWWAAMGTWLLLRRCAGVGFVPALAGAVAFAFSMWVVSWQYLPTVPATAAWLPWVLLAAARWSQRLDVRSALWWGTTMGLCLLAGHLQIAFYVILASLLLVVLVLRGWRSQRVLSGFVAFATALSLSAPQLLPAMELAQLSHRRAAATAEGYAAYVGSAMPVAHLFTLFLPDFFGHPGVARTDAPDVSTYWGKGNYAEYACFMGLPAMLLAALGACTRRSTWRVYALLIAGLALLLALGTPLNALLYFGVPGFSGTGSPARVLVLWAFGVALLTGLGVERLCTASRRDWLFALGTLIVMLLVGAVPARTMTEQTLGEGAFKELLGAGMPVLIQSLALAGLVGGVVFAVRWWSWSATVASSVAACCVVGGLWIADMDFNPTAPADTVYPVSPLLQRARDLSAQKWRVVAVQQGWSLYRAPESILPPNLATAVGLYDLQIYDSLMPLSSKRWLDKLNGRDSAPVENGNMALMWRAPAGKLASVGVRYVLALEPLDDPDLHLVSEGAEGKLYEVAGAQSWVRAEDALPCDFRWQGCNRLRISVPEGKERLLVMQTDYPGWRVEPSGGILSVEDTFQRVQVTAGTREITLRFEPDLLRVCLYFSLVALAGVIAGLLGTTVQEG